VEPVRSALAAVNGVVRADVFFEGHEAVIEYDASRCTVDDLIAAVGGVKDPTMPVTFRAEVKK
jgi:copper chaperone CopZ